MLSIRSVFSEALPPRIKSKYSAYTVLENQTNDELISKNKLRSLKIVIYLCLIQVQLDSNSLHKTYLKQTIRRVA
ncbi:MAG: hypothetical protein V7K68_17435 [Nostoc sp.]|uniref:hypothetical protein n=1 Tax=Nostoc sp. TaxID=1180 RepID=UPI002FF665C4